MSRRIHQALDPGIDAMFAACTLENGVDPIRYQ
jgi:hypothetical protein